MPAAILTHQVVASAIGCFQQSPSLWIASYHLRIACRAQLPQNGPFSAGHLLALEFVPSSVVSNLVVLALLLIALALSPDVALVGLSCAAGAR